MEGAIFLALMVVGYILDTRLTRIARAIEALAKQEPR